MALSNLTPLTQSEYEGLNLTSISPAPIETEIGDPDSKATVRLGGVTDSGDLAFIISDPLGTRVGIDPSLTNTLAIDIPEGPTSNPQDTYWTISLGINASGPNWQIGFQVDDGNKDTGTWVFTKGKVVDDILKKMKYSV